MLTPPRSAALVSVLLALPFVFMFALLVLGLEPPFAALLKGPPDQPNVVGTAVVLGGWVLTLVAFFINFRPVVRAVRAGNPLTTLPLNLFVGAALLLVLALFVAAIVVDQYRCWIGVPNCD